MTYSERAEYVPLAVGQQRWQQSLREAQRMIHIAVNDRAVDHLDVYRDIAVRALEIGRAEPLHDELVSQDVIVGFLEGIDGTKGIEMGRYKGLALRYLSSRAESLALVHQVYVSSADGEEGYEKSFPVAHTCIEPIDSASTVNSKGGAIVVERMVEDFIVNNFHRLSSLFRRTCRAAADPLEMSERLLERLNWNLRSHWGEYCELTANSEHRANNGALVFMPYDSGVAISGQPQYIESVPVWRRRRGVWHMSKTELEPALILSDEDDVTHLVPFSSVSQLNVLPTELVPTPTRRMSRARMRRYMGGRVIRPAYPDS